MGQRFHQTQLHRLACQRPQRPVVMTLGSRGARPGLSGASLPGHPACGTDGLGPVLQHTVQPAPGEAPLDAVYAGLDHPGSGPALAGLKQDAGPGRYSRRTPAGPDQVLQPVAFLRRQPDRKFLSDPSDTSQQHLP